MHKYISSLKKHFACNLQLHVGFIHVIAIQFQVFNHTTKFNKLFDMELWTKWTIQGRLPNKCLAIWGRSQEQVYVPQKPHKKHIAIILLKYTQFINSFVFKKTCLK
jgi:hypothetical protein